jgi:glycosyltransferase involved in cell wall biosynthesis
MNTPEITVVIPCLNEERTVALCVKDALDAFRSGGLQGEVVVADNGSTDQSRSFALAAGARVICVERRGYGAALMAGIEAAGGRFVVMGDADGSYDFGETARFVALLRGGAELVQGCRLPSAGGKLDDGAMPWLHRYVGNPGLTWLARRMFRTPVHDVYCGLRGFTKARYLALGLRCTGMEFATEMIIKAALHDVPTAEVPVTLRRDGRGGRAPHLRTFRDGWRTLRLFLLFSPRWVHVIPGMLLTGFGLLLGILALFGAKIGPATLGPHSLLVASAALLVGKQALWMGVFARTFATIEGIAPVSPGLAVFRRYFTLERVIMLALLSMAAGIVLIAVVFMQWRGQGYGELDYAKTLLWVVPGISLVALGGQALIGSFALSLLTLERK